jgi:hypothetical protein
LLWAGSRPVPAGPRNRPRKAPGGAASGLASGTTTLGPGKESRSQTTAGALIYCLAGVSEVKPANAAGVKLEIRRAESKPAEGLTEATVVGTIQKVYLHKGVELTFTKEGGKKMAKVTKEHHNKPLAYLIDGKVIAALTVQSEISKFAYITGKFTKAEAEKIAAGIKGK